MVRRYIRDGLCSGKTAAAFRALIDRIMLEVLGYLVSWRLGITLLRIVRRVNESRFSKSPFQIHIMNSHTPTHGGTFVYNKRTTTSSNQSCNCFLGGVNAVDKFLSYPVP